MEKDEQFLSASSWERALLSLKGWQECVPPITGLWCSMRMCPEKAEGLTGQMAHKLMRVSSWTRWNPRVKKCALNTSLKNSIFHFCIWGPPPYDSHCGSAGVQQWGSIFYIVDFFLEMSAKWVHQRCWSPSLAGDCPQGNWADPSLPTTFQSPPITFTFCSSSPFKFPVGRS